MLKYYLERAGQFYPESEKAELCARIITPPIYAKTLLETLRGAIDRYEQAFGVIQGELLPAKEIQ